MSEIPGKTAAKAAGVDDPHRVMVVDDSAVIRGLLSRALEGDPELRVVASVGDGQMALNALSRQSIDVIVLDIEMPVMDGIDRHPEADRDRSGGEDHHGLHPDAARGRGQHEGAPVRRRRLCDQAVLDA